MDEDAPDLEWGGADPEDPDAEEATVSEGRSRERTPLQYPSTPTDHATWGEYFADVKRRDAARKASQVDAPPTLVSSGDPGMIPASPKSVIAAATAMHWDVTVREWTMHHTDEYYAGDSKATGASAGDLKKAARDTSHLGVLGRMEGARLGFYAEWQLGKTPKGARSAKWDHAKIVDPVGIPRELAHGYVIDKNQAKALGLSDEAATQLTNRRAAEYNDGATWLVKTLVIDRAGELTLWLEDWMELLIPGYERPVKKASKTAEPHPVTAEQMMTGTEWIG